MKLFAVLLVLVGHSALASTRVEDKNCIAYIAKTTPNYGTLSDDQLHQITQALQHQGYTVKLGSLNRNYIVGHIPELLGKTAFFLVPEVEWTSPTTGNINVHFNNLDVNKLGSHYAMLKLHGRSNDEIQKDIESQTRQIMRKDLSFRRERFTVPQSRREQWEAVSLEVARAGLIHAAEKVPPCSRGDRFRIVSEGSAQSGQAEEANGAE